MATDIGELLVKFAADLKNLDAGIKKAKKDLTGLKSHAESFTSGLRKAFAFVGLGAGIYAATSLIKRGFQEAMRASDDFHLSTIGAAATITDMADTAGRTTQDTFEQAFSYAKGMYFELQEAAAKYFASGADMVQAWNVLIQKGMVLRKGEIDNLGILVDKIKLATQGQMGYYQIAQEIRAFMDGHANSASQLAMLLKCQVGPEWKKIAEEVRKTQSLAPLIEHIKGLQYATPYIEKTLESAFSTMKTHLQRIAVEGGGVVYDSVVAAVQRVNNWLKGNRITINFYISETWKKLEGALASIWSWAKQVGSNLYTIFATAGKSVWGTFGAALLNLIKVIAQVVLSVTKWMAANANLISTLARMYIVAKITAMVIGFGAAIVRGVTALRGFIAVVPAVVAGAASLSGAARSAWLAFGGWAGAIAMVTFELGRLAIQGVKKVKEMVTEQPSLGATMLMGETAGLMDQETRAKLDKMDAAAAKKQQEEWSKTHRGPFTIPTKEQDILPPALKPPAGLGGKEGGGGKDAKGATEDMLRYLTEYLEAKRKLELQEAEESYATFKADQDRKRAELDLFLAEGKVTGQDYYRALRDMAQAEADASLALIQAKIAKEKEAYAWAQKEVGAEAKEGKISTEAQDLALKKLAAEHTLRLKELEGEALREKIDLQREVVDLTKQEYENRERIADTLASGLEEAALGPIAEKEAEINRLLRERFRLRQEMVQLGATEEQLGTFDATTKALKFNKQFGDQIKGYVDLISGFFSDLCDAFMDGEVDLRETLKKFFTSLFKKALEPALEQMKQWLADAFKGLGDSLGFGGGGGGGFMDAIMGAVGLAGMLLTGGGGESKFTPAGIESPVTSTEPVRGIIAGETSIPIAEISVSLSEAVAPHLHVLRQIEANTRGGGGGGGRLDINIKGIQEAVREAMEVYFREYLLMGAR